MQKLCGERTCERIHRCLLLRRQRAEMFRGTSQLGLAKSFGVLLQRDDGGHHVKRLQVLMIFLDFRTDDLLRGCGR